MSNSTDSATAIDFLSGGGEMGELIRTYDWSTSELGPAGEWPFSLRSALSICINSNFPIAIYWGEELNLLYNNAWSPIPGNKHPWALGKPAKEVWPEIWDNIGPLFEEAFGSRKATGSKDALLPMQRHGYTEECYFDFTFTPIYGDSGKVEGIFNAVIETTYRFINERRSNFLQKLNVSINSLSSEREVFERAATALDTAREDIPFYFLYAVNNDGVATVVHSSERSSARMVQPWPFEKATESFFVVTALSGFVQPVPQGCWPEPPREAVILPFKRNDGMVVGYLVSGINSRRTFDRDYQLFFESVATALSAELNTISALAHERRRAESLAEIDRAKTTFFSNISHELRTPLTLMLAPIEEMIEQEEVSPAAKENLAIAYRNTLRLQKLVNTLLDFSRIEAGRMEANFAETDIGSFTTDLVSSFRSAIEKADMT